MAADDGVGLEAGGEEVFVLGCGHAQLDVGEFSEGAFCLNFQPDLGAGISVFALLHGDSHLPGLFFREIANGDHGSGGNGEGEEKAAEMENTGHDVRMTRGRGVS